MAEPDTTPHYVVAGCRPWNRTEFNAVASKLPGNWIYVADKAELTVERLEPLAPRYVFFLHWSWIVPDAIIDHWECVVFHMTDVPYGRGGTPLQNLILRGHDKTVVSALQMTAEVDAGPVYAKRPLSLAGPAEEIYVRATRISLDLMAEIVASEPVPKPQVGPAVLFERRTPGQSEIPECTDLDQFADFVRMLDANGYPRAQLRHGGLILEFRRATRYAGEVHADVRVTVADGETET